jgi:type I restriction enzyme S subunit
MRVCVFADFMDGLLLRVIVSRSGGLEKGSDEIRCSLNELQESTSWEQRKLGEMANFNPKEDLPKEFEYVDLESVVGTEMISHRHESKRTAPSRAQRLARHGDLFYQTVRPYQKNNYLFENTDNNYVFSTGYAQMRPYVDGRFLFGLVQSDRFVKVVLDNCTGTSYPAISSNDLADIEVRCPSKKKEQQAMGTFLSKLDKSITLHQRWWKRLHLMWCR